MKRPSFQFYPGDWLNDAALRLCSVGARGLWIEIICLMHQGSKYGHLKVNHKVILTPNLARMVGADLTDVQGWLNELESAGVFSRDKEGCIFSRRMVKDEKLRNLRALGGKLGGNPALKKVNLNTNLKPTPSSSSSSSSSSSLVNIPLLLNGVDGEKKEWKPVQEQIRLAALFHRKPITPWSKKEISAWRAITPIPEDDMARLEKFYLKTNHPKDADYRKRKLITFLNDFNGAMDMASRPVKPDHNL